jgi:putative ABC transport system permease protein
MKRVWKDLRGGLRQLGKRPGLTVLAVLTLALGVGATTAIYTVVHGVVIAPLPYPDEERLIRVESPVPGVAENAVWHISTTQYLHFRERASTFESLGIYTAPTVAAQVAGNPDLLPVAQVSFEMMELLGARPALGRLILESDDRAAAPRVAMISHEYWQGRFGGDPDAIGQTVELWGTRWEIVGVLAPGVRLPLKAGATPDMHRRDLWIPMRVDPAGPLWNQHDSQAIARLAPGASLDDVRLELLHLTADLPDAFPQVYDEDFMRDFGFTTRPVELREYVLGDVARNLWILFGAVWIVLLVAGANVANLLLVRLEARRRELAVRAALGAGRGAIARHLLAEGAVLAFLAGALGMLLALGGTAWLLSLPHAESLPRVDNVTLGVGEVLFGFGVSFLLALSISGLVAMRAPEPSISLMGEDGRGTTAGRQRVRLRAALVASQMALALVLLVGAGLLIESFAKLRAIELGFEPDNALAVYVLLPQERYQDMAAVWRFHDQLHDRVAALPGVTGVATGGLLPVLHGQGCQGHQFEDAGIARRGETGCANLVPTTPGYFETLGIPLLSGRLLTRADNDTPERGAVVVSRAFAEQFWPGEDPIGKGISPATEGPPYYRVVGVVGDVPAGSVDGPPVLNAYYPVVPIPERWGWQLPHLALVMRLDRGEPATLLPAIRETAREIEPGAVLGNPLVMPQVVRNSMGRLSFTMSLLAIAGALSLLLAAVGLYGVISHVVTSRRREVGVRIALGARPWQVQRQVVGRAMALVTVGLGAGVLVALGTTRLLQSFLYGVEPIQPSAFLAAVVVLGGVALAASWLPARRASRVDPVIALRAE